MSYNAVKLYNAPRVPSLVRFENSLYICKTALPRYIGAYVGHKIVGLNLSGVYGWGCFSCATYINSFVIVGMHVFEAHTYTYVCR
jgi:hypothetical protein